MKTYLQVGRVGGLAALACAIALAVSAAPASAVPCPKGSTDPVYCAHLIAQVKQIKTSTLQIEKSYNEIVASTLSILKKVKSQSTKNQVNALLAKASALDAKKKALLKLANIQTDVYKQRASVATARQDIAIARQEVAQARVIAAIAVATGG